MENVTKALLIAAGILLAVMILSLLVIFWGQMSGYYEEQHKAKIIEQDTEFNAKFENYNQQTIRGNELMSVMNNVVDYNSAIADMEGYDKIIMTVDFKGYQNNEFQYSSSDSNPNTTESIFKNIIGSNGKLSNTQSSDSNLEAITNLAGNISAETGYSDMQLQKLSSEIQNIAIDSQLNSNKISDNQKTALKETRNKKLQNILGKSKADSLSNEQMSKLIKATEKYYQYTQLKRAMFKCTGVQHNTTENGRVNGITFEVVVENNKVKFN